MYRIIFRKASTTIVFDFDDPYDAILFIKVATQTNIDNVEIYMIYMKKENKTDDNEK